MLIIDPIIFRLQKIGGISVYWNNILKYFKDNVDMNMLSRPKLEKYNNKYYNKVLQMIPINNKFSKNDIFQSTYYTYSNNKYVSNVITVHDFIDERYNYGIKKSLNIYIKYNAIKNSEFVVCISKNTEKDLRKYMPGYKGEVRVVYNGVADEYCNIKNSTRKDYILFVGSRAKYKRFDLAVETIRKLKNIDLYIVGGGELKKSEKVYLENEIPKRYKKYDYINNQTLNKLYNEAFCLLYPSEYEGFGIPIIEAMKAGCPVIAQNKSSIPEISNGAAILINNSSSDEIISDLSILKYDRYRNDIIHKGMDQANKFSWKSTAENYLNIYKEILSK